MTQIRAEPLDPVLAQNLPPSLDVLWVPKRSGTYPDVLEACGLALLVDHIFQQRLGGVGGWKIQVEDAGGHYRIRLDRPLETAWLADLPYFRSPAFYILRGRDKNRPRRTWISGTWTPSGSRCAPITPSARSCARRGCRGPT